MKTKMMVLLLTPVLFACNTASPPSTFDKSVAVPLMELSEVNGCQQCHKLDVPFRGPSWTQIAARYDKTPANANVLKTKTRMGGGGNWTKETGGAPMPPQAPRVSERHIDEMINYILSLDE